MSKSSASWSVASLAALACASSAFGADTTPPDIFAISGSARTSAGVTTLTAQAADNSGPAGIVMSIYVDGRRVKQVSGGVITHALRSRKPPRRSVLRFEARDAVANVRVHSMEVVQ